MGVKPRSKKSAEIVSSVHYLPCFSHVGHTKKTTFLMNWGVPNFIKKASPPSKTHQWQLSCPSGGPQTDLWAFSGSPVGARNQLRWKLGPVIQQALTKDDSKMGQEPKMRSKLVPESMILDGFFKSPTLASCWKKEKVSTQQPLLPNGGPSSKFFWTSEGNTTVGCHQSLFVRIAPGEATRPQ